MRKINLTVDFVAEVPDNITDEDLPGIVLDVDPNALRICDGAVGIPLGRVIAHTTTDCWADDD